MITSSARSPEEKTESRVVTSSGTPTVRTELEGAPGSVGAGAQEAPRRSTARIALIESSPGPGPLTNESGEPLERVDRDHDRHTGEERDPPFSGHEIVAPLLHHQPPPRLGNLDAETEKAGAGDHLERPGAVDRELREGRTRRIGEEMPHQDPEASVAGGSSGFDEL